MDGSHHYEDIEFLESVKEDEFYDYFSTFAPKELSSEIRFYIRDLYNQVKACLDLADSTDEPYKTIGENVKRAVIRIALDCQINKVRVAGWFKLSEEEIEEARAMIDKKS